MKTIVFDCSGFFSGRSNGPNDRIIEASIWYQEDDRHEIVTVNGLRAGNWNWEKSHLRFWDGKMLKRKKKRKSMLNMERWDIRNS